MKMKHELNPTEEARRETHKFYFLCNHVSSTAKVYPNIPLITDIIPWLFYLQEPQRGCSQSNPVHWHILRKLDRESCAAATLWSRLLAAMPTSAQTTSMWPETDGLCISQGTEACNLQKILPHRSSGYFDISELLFNEGVRKSHPLRKLSCSLNHPHFPHLIEGEHEQLSLCPSLSLVPLQKLPGRSNGLFESASVWLNVKQVTLPSPHICISVSSWQGCQ